MAKLPAGAPPDGDSGFLSRWSRRKAQVRQGDVPVQPVRADTLAVPVPVPAAPLAGPALRPLPAAGPAAPGETAPGETAPGETAPAETAPAPPPPPPPPTLADVAALTRDSDYARFVAPGVDVGIKNAALKKLFTDPHFNIMDRLDTYIDDYGQPDPLPAGMLRQMAQSQFLGLFTDDEDKPPTLHPAIHPGADPSADPGADARADPRAEAPAERLPDPPVDSLACPTPTPDEDPDLRLQPNAAAGPSRAGQSAGPDTGRQH